MAHDVFISYSNKDKPTADAVCASLEVNGIRCWIAPRDIIPGTDWGESIIDAIHDARVMLLIFSSNSNTSPQIKREIERAVNKGIPVIPFRIEDVMPSKTLEYFISTQHWLDALSPPLEKHLQNLAANLKVLLSRKLDGERVELKEPRFIAPPIDKVQPSILETAELPAKKRRELTPGDETEKDEGKIDWLPLIVLLSLVVIVSLVGGGIWWKFYSVPAKPELAKVETSKAELPKPSPPPDLTVTEPKLSAEEYFSQGFKTKDAGEKISLFTKAIALKPDYAAAYNNRGNAYYGRKEYDLALQDYNEAIKINPDYDMALMNRGLTYAAKREYDRALADYSRAIALNPNYTDAYNNRGNAYLNKKDYALALNDYNTAIALNPSWSLPYYNRGLVYKNKQEYDNAISDFSMAISLDPNYYNAYYNRGNAYLEKNETDKAIADLTKAISLHTDSAEAYASRGNVYFYKKDFAPALSDLHKAISLSRNYVYAYVTRGKIYAAKGEAEFALNDYNKAIALNPNYAIAYSRRGNLYAAKRDYDRALEDFSKAIDLKGNLADNYYNRAKVYKLKGELEKAREDYEKARSLDPQLPPL
jgi:tetratricopeptide (TPR) repeat protein